MALYVHNLTGAPITLAGTTVVVPISAAPPARGPAVNVTSELRGLTNGQYAALEAQRVAGPSLSYEWNDAPEYLIGTLKFLTGPPPGPHETTHATGGADALTVSSGTAAVSASQAAHDHTGATGSTSPGVTASFAVIRHERYALPDATTSTVFITATAVGDASPKALDGVQPNCPRVCQTTLDGAWVSTDDVVITVTGVVETGNGDTEVFTIPLGSAPGALQLTKAFISITNVAFTKPAGWTAGTFDLEAGTALGLIHTAPETGLGWLQEVGYAGVGAAVDMTIGTLDGVHFTYIPTTALDGAHNVEVWYSTNLPATVGGTAHTHTIASATPVVSTSDAGHTHNLT